MPRSKTLIRLPPHRERRAAAGMTGRYLLTLQPGAHETVSARLSAVGLAAAKPASAATATPHALPQGAHLLLPRLGIAVVDPLPEQEDALHQMAAQEDAVLAIEPERIVRTVAPANGADYVRGWRDAIDALAARLLAAPAAPSMAAAEVAATWGLQATRVVDSSGSGAGIKIAVLDTGLDLNHPDFAGRNITTANFVGDTAPFHDGVGHGTHCTGTAAGPLRPAQGPRYGIAHQALIHAGRVLDDTGHGGDANILQGIHWAVENQCEVISLSLGAPWLPGDPPYSPAYEQAAQQALAAGCLMVVAARNDAEDPRYVGAVGTPGNSPSVLTVAAVDDQLRTAAFSNRATPDAPGVKGPDIAGPGVDVYSCWPVADKPYNTISGTSMATPHVAGIAALLAQSNATLRGQALKDAVLAKVRGLDNAQQRQGEIGRGLVQAPP